MFQIVFSIVATNYVRKQFVHIGERMPSREWIEQKLGARLLKLLGPVDLNQIVAHMNYMLDFWKPGHRPTNEFSSGGLVFSCIAHKEATCLPTDDSKLPLSPSTTETPSPELLTSALG